MLEKTQFEIRIQSVSLIIFISFIGSVFLCYFQGAYLGNNFPDNTFLFMPNDAFNDFFNVMKQIVANKPYDNELAIGYGPLVLLVLNLFKFTPKIWLLGFCYLLFTLSQFLQIRNTYKLKSESIFTKPFELFSLVFLIYPYLLILDRGNIEMFTAILFSAVVFSLQKNRYFAVAILIAIMASIKIYFCLLFFMFTLGKQYRYFTIGILSFLLINLVSYFFVAVWTDLGFFEVISQHIKALTMYSSTSTISKALFMNHTFGALISNITAQIQPVVNDSIINLYRLSSPIVGLILIAFSHKRNLPNWAQLFILVGVMVMFPLISFDYTLINFFFPMVLFLNFKGRERYDKIIAICFGLLLSTIPYLLKIKGVYIAPIVYIGSFLTISYLVLFKRNTSRLQSGS